MKKLLIITILGIFSFIISANFILAAGTEDAPKTNPSANVVSLVNPLSGTASSKDIPTFLGQIISYAMGIIGSLALVMIIYGGATWMLSAGSSEKVSKGKEIITWAALGLALIFTSYAIVKFVISALSGT